MSRTRPSSGPFADWDNEAWDHPVRLLDAIRLWSPEFARRLDQLKAGSADEIRITAQQRRRARMRHDRPPSERTRQRDRDEGGDSTAETALGLVDPEIPNSLRDDLARLLREWNRWNDKDRLINASKLAGRLIIENTRPGQPYILKCSPPVPPANLSAEYVPVGEAAQNGLGPYDFDLRSSMIRNLGGNWVPARILGGIEAEGERMRVARLAREAEDAAAAAAWANECAQPMRARQNFLYGEIADALSRKPGRLEINGAERTRIILDLADWTCRGEFDLSGDSEVVILSGEPPHFLPFGPVRPGDILADPEALILRRHALHRYLLNSGISEAKRLLNNWFPEVSEVPSSPGGPVASVGAPSDVKPTIRAAIAKA